MYIHSMIESLLGDIDPSFTSAKTSKTTSNTPSKHTTNKGKGSTTSVVPDDEGGETFCDWLSSLEASGGVTRGGGGSVRESFDRIDSERVLDDLMRELDSTSPTTVKTPNSSSSDSYKPTDNNDRHSKRVEVPSIEAWGSSSPSSSNSDISEVYSNTYDNLASQLSGTEISIDDLLGPTVPAIDTGTGTMPTSISVNAGKKVWTPRSSSSATTNTAYTAAPTPTSNTANNKNSYTKPTPSTSAAPLTSAGVGSGAAPDMEQYPNFEAYIAAVLEYEQNKGVSGSSPSTSTKEGQKYDPFDDDDIVVVKKETVADDQYDKSNYIYSKYDDSNSNARSNKYTKSAVSYTPPSPIAEAADDYFIDESYSTTTPPTNDVSVSTSGGGGGSSDDEFFADFLDEFYASSSTSDDSNIKTKPTPIDTPAVSKAASTLISTASETTTLATEGFKPTTSISDTVTTSTLESTSLPATKVTTTTTSSSSSSNTDNNEYTTMTVVALKQILKDKGLKISGTKTELINRLIES